MEKEKVSKKKKKIIFPIIPTLLLAVGLAIIVNPPIFKYEIDTPTGKANIEIKLSAYFYRYLFAPITAQYKLVSATDNEVIRYFKDIRDITNHLLNTTPQFAFLYSKLSDKYPMITLCVETSESRFQCATYILYSRLVIMTYDVSSEYRIIMFKRGEEETGLIPKSFMEVYTYYKNGDIKATLESLARLYNEGKVIFYNWDAKDLFEALSS